MTGAGKVRVSQFGATNNAVEVAIGDLTLYFSYETLIAYDDNVDGRVVCNNIWSGTTGKHLNYVDGGDKSGRLKGDEFDKKVAAMLKRHGLEA
jgi:hypothetical protein